MDIMNTIKYDVNQVKLPAQSRNAFFRINIFMFVFKRPGHHHHINIIRAIVLVDNLFEGREIFDDENILFQFTIYDLRFCERHCRHHARGVRFWISDFRFWIYNLRFWMVAELRRTEWEYEGAQLLVEV